MPRVWVDGCFDLLHFGHANIFRQAKEISQGATLVAGVCNDEDTSRNKGPTVFTESERYRLTRAIKWVDEVVEGSPYFPNVDTMEKHGVDFAVHGDDISVSECGDPYIALKVSGRYKECSRTHGVSTTDIVTRLLRCSEAVSGEYQNDNKKNTAKVQAKLSPWTGQTQFLPTTSFLAQFSNQRRPSSNDRVVYVSGSFDLFNVGHLDFLEKVAALGDYLIVGLYTDHVVKQNKGACYPIMSLFERTFSVLSYRVVDEVIMGAPYVVTEELMDQFNIDLVCHGTLMSNKDLVDDPHEVPKRLNKFQLVPSGNDLTTEKIVERVAKRRNDYFTRNSDKEAKEALIYDALSSPKKKEQTA